MVKIVVLNELVTEDLTLEVGAQEIELGQIDLITEGIQNGSILFSQPSRKLPVIVKELNLLILNLLIQQNAQKTELDTLRADFNEYVNGKG